MRRLLEMAEGRIREILNEMRRLSIEALDEAAKAFEGGSSVSRARELSRALKRMYQEVVDLAAEAIARYSPVARDLRFLQTAPEVAYDLYRVGRYSYDIVRLYTDMPCRADLGQTLGLVKRLVEDSVNGYLSGSAEVYEAVERMDDEVDNAYLSVVREVLERPDRCGVVRLLAMKFLERASDHATYIAEKAYYVSAGSYPEQ